jgi:dimethylhistidine N-methyltransferase
MAVHRLAPRPRHLNGFRAEVAAAALAGLEAPRKTLPPKLFYDEEGCRLFGAITELPEYYPTRTELALLPGVARAVAARVPAGAAVVEYGASSEQKAELLLDALAAPRAYVPIDVAERALAGVAMRLARSRPALPVFPIATDFLQPLTLPDAVGEARLGFFPGSTIGNLDPAEARRFLAQARATLGPEARFLVGVDLRKSADVLVPAYDDAAGVTAAFNLNLLRRLNREAAATFALDGFAHRAVWNAAEGRIEMHLVSLREQTVRVADRPIRFARGETIHTENSYKPTPEAFAALAHDAGWRVEEAWTAPREQYSLQLLAAA